MSTVDRAALIEAGARAIADPDDFSFAGERDGRAEGCRTLAEDIIDAVLPRVADAIEDPIRHGEAVHYEFCSLAQAGALVRSLLSTDSDR